MLSRKAAAERDRKKALRQQSAVGSLGGAAGSSTPLFPLQWAFLRAAPLEGKRRTHGRGLALRPRSGPVRVGVW